jgi:DNA-binding XRE family transcriptional regulator
MVMLPRLKALRVERALSQRALAQKAGVTQVTIVRAERGCDVQPGTHGKLAAALGVRPRDLMDGATREHPRP